MPISNNFVRRLSIAQRELLIRHVPLNQVQVHLTSSGMACRRSLISLGLLSIDNVMRPRFTWLTEKGREAVAVLLGEYADALVAAGCLEISPWEKLEELKKMGSVRQKNVPSPREVFESIMKLDQ